MAAESPHRTPGSDSSSATPGSDDDIERWNRDIERSIAFFDRMQHWSIAARKSRDVVQKLYDATKYVAENNAQFHQQQSELLQRRLSTAPRTPVEHQAMTNTDMFNAANMFPTNLPMGGLSEMGNYNNFMNTGWGISPHGEAAMNDFWNEMMWDTFPSDMPDSANYMEVGQTDWWPQGQGQQDWMQWPQNGGHQQ